MRRIINTNSVILARIQIFALKDLRLFLVGILFVSTTSGAIGAFMLGVTEEEFFIGEADNILIVAEPGTTTPLTGRVPEYLQTDIQKLRGIISISAETLCFVVAQNLNDKSLLVRGITPNFSNVTPLSLIEGQWFDPSYGVADEINVNGAMIGYLLAEELGLSYGDKIQVASTLTNIVVEIVITGMIRTNSPSDKELLVPLSIGKTMTGRGLDFVSFLRVLINEDIITKERLSETLNSEFTISFVLTTQDPNLVSFLLGTPIIAYTPYGAHVATHFIQEGFKTDFKLLFGTYEFIATPKEVQSSPSLTVFMNRSYTEPFEISIGIPHHDLQLNITHNRKPASNATVHLLEKFRNETVLSSLTDIQGLVQFNAIPEYFYQIRVNHREIQKNVTFFLNESKDINIELETSLSLTIIDFNSRMEIQGGTVKILDNNSEINGYISGTLIYLDPGEHHFEYEFNGFNREFSLDINGSMNYTIILGNVSLIIGVRDENEIGLESVNVTIVRTDEVIAQALTDINGSCTFELEVDLAYRIFAVPAENQTRVQIYDIILRNTSYFVIEFLEALKLDIIVFNGTAKDIFDYGLADSIVKIFKNNTIVASGVTNTSGKISFNITEAGDYQISAVKGNYVWNKTIKVSNKSTSYNISLGRVQLSISTISVSGTPISEAIVTLTNETGYIYRSMTNSSGFLEFSIPVGNYSLNINKSVFFSREEITFPLSTRLSLQRIIELSGNLTIILTNQFSQYINKAYIILTNEYYNIRYKGFSDINGEITFFGVPWGNCSVHITFDELTFLQQKIEFIKENENYQLQIDTQNPILNLEEYDWESRSSFSIILSSEYVSGFLETTLSIILTTFAALVIIISVLSLLSIASVISQPIVSNEKTLRTFRQVGATQSQVIVGVVVHLGVLGALASGLGSILGMWIMTIFPTLKNINVGGIIIRPRIDLWLMIIVIFSNSIVIILKAVQKLHEFFEKTIAS